MDEDLASRRYRLVRACEKILSGPRPVSMAQRLAELSSAAGGAELDGRPDGYGDGLVCALEDRVARMVDKPAAAFFPTGTMAQQVALRCWAAIGGNQVVAMHPQSHLEVHERHAYASLSGLHAAWSTDEPRQPTAQEIRELGEPFGTLVVELPLRDAGFLLPTWSELTELVAAARDRGARVHFDGARLWETTVHLGHDLAGIAALADSVYLSFYKSLGGLSGAMLVGPSDFIAHARAWRHRYGGRTFSQFPAILAALVGLDVRLPQLTACVAHAATIAAALAALPGSRVHPAVPHTHQFQLLLPHPAADLTEAALAMAEQDKVWFVGGWTDQGQTGYAMAEVTVAEPALQWSAADVRRHGEAFLSRLTSRRPA